MTYRDLSRASIHKIILFWMPHIPIVKW